jgi:FixJ family two-component response regulator
MTTPLTSPQVIVVDDDQAVRRSLQLLLRGHGYRVKAYADAGAVANDPDAAEAALLVTDYRLSNEDGFDVLRGMRERGWHGSALLITGYNTPALTTDASAAGFESVLDKPIRPNLLLGAARAAVARSLP